jgi:hypothetical protein
MELYVEYRALHVLVEHCNPELHPQPKIWHFKLNKIASLTQCHLSSLSVGNGLDSVTHNSFITFSQLC